jgi:hypothetical protein
MKAKLDAFSNKASTGKYPGGKEIDQGIVLLVGLTEKHSSFSFIELFLSNDNELRDFEEDYQDLENFFETQFSTWQNLDRALTQNFERNRSTLEKNESAFEALTQLDKIYNNTRPYRDIRNIEPLIKKIRTINDELISDKRAHAKSRIEFRISQVKQQIDEVNLPSELSNKALRPLQVALKRLASLQGIAEILQEQADSINLEDDAHELINRYIEQKIEQQETARIQSIKQAEQYAEQEAKSKREEAKQKGETAGVASVVYEPIKPAVPPKAAEPAPKKIVSVDTSSVMRDVNQSGVIETEQDIDTYLNALRDKLSTLVAANNKVRIK